MTSHVRSALRLAPLAFLLAPLGLLLAPSCGNTAPTQPAGLSGPPTHGTTNTPTDGQRVRVLLEVDNMAGTTKLEPVQTFGAQTVSLVDIYKAGGIDLTIRQDQSDLPKPPTLTLGDLHGIMSQYDNVQNDQDRKVYALIATADDDDAGTLGIMFDMDAPESGLADENRIPREGFAVFATAHQDLGPNAGNATQEVLLTTAHELAHCFNIHHTDWEGGSFRRDATIESYSMTTTVRWALSANSVLHLTQCPRELVLMGQGAMPFGFETHDHLARHQQTPNESYQEVARNPVTPAARTDHAAPSWVVLSAARSASAARTASSPLRLTLAPAKPTFEVGEPTEIRCELSNPGTAAVDVLPLLDPAYGFLHLEIAREGSAETRAYRPPVLKEARGAKRKSLAPGESVGETCKVFFGAGGWVFTEAGKYTIRAVFSDLRDTDAPYIEADPLALEIRPPANSEASKLALSPQAGLFLYFGGGDHLKQGVSALKDVVEKHPGTAQATNARYALGMAALRPSYDAKASRRPDTRLDEAQQYLKGILQTDLPADDLLKCQSKLADALDADGKPAEANAVRSEALRKLAPDQLPKVDLLKPEQMRGMLRGQDVKSLQRRIREL